MGSTKLTAARPVRRPPKSCFKASTAPCMRRLSSFASKGVGCAMALVSRHNRKFARPVQGGKHRTVRADRKHNYRNPVVPCKRDGGRVHDAQIAGQYFPKGNSLETL